MCVYAHDDHYLMRSKFNSLLTEMITPQTYKYNIYMYIYTYKTASCPSCIRGSLRLTLNYLLFFYFAAGDNLDYGPFNSPSLSVMARLLADEVAVPFGVVIREDNRVEYEERFSASLSLPPSNGSNVRLGAMSKTTVFIRDNDSKIV